MKHLNSREAQAQVQTVYTQLHEQRNRVDALIGQLVVWEKSVLRPLAEQLHDEERKQACKDLDINLHVLS